MRLLLSVLHGLCNRVIMSRRIDRLVEAAYKEALKSTGRHRHGAIVVGSGGRILAKACNHYGSGQHAEVRALKRVAHDAKDDVEELIVVRILKSQKFGLSRPCKACQTAIKATNIRVVYFSTSNSVLGEEFYS